MARQHQADHRPLHPGRILSTYPIFEIADGPWPGRLALGPVPIADDAPAAIVAWGAATVVGLTDPQEAARLGRADLASHLASAGLPWLPAPIDDFSAPGASFELAWPALRARLLERLDAGDKILVHCRGGLGRSGTVAAALLIAAGLTPNAAVGAVRRARPGAIETAEQEAWLSRQTGAAR